MKIKILFYAVLVLICPLLSKADDAGYGYDEVEETDANEIEESYSNYCIITDQTINFPSNTFAVCSTNLGWMTAAEYKRIKLSDGQTRFSTPFGSKEFVVASLTDATKDLPMKAHFIVFQDDHPKWQFDFINFRQFDADWIDEKIIKIVSWVSTRVRVTELINVETGKIAYRSADGIFDSLKDSTPVK